MASSLAIADSPFTQQAGRPSKFPAEVKNKIYQFVFSSIQIRPAGKRDCSECQKPHERLRDLTKGWRLLLSCKSIYREAFLLYYSLATLTCTSDDIHRPCFPVALQRNITRLSIRMDASRFGGRESPTDSIIVNYSNLNYIRLPSLDLTAAVRDPHETARRDAILKLGFQALTVSKPILIKYLKSLPTWRILSGLALQKYLPQATIEFLATRECDQLFKDHRRAGFNTVTIDATYNIKYDYGEYVQAYSVNFKTGEALTWIWRAYYDWHYLEGDIEGVQHVTPEVYNKAVTDGDDPKLAWLDGWFEGARTGAHPEAALMKKKRYFGF